MAVTEALVLAIARRHQAEMLSIASRFAGLSGGTFAKMRPISDADLAMWAAQMEPSVVAARTAAARSTVAQYSATVALDSRRLPAVDLAPIITGLRNGLPIGDLLARPVITVRRMLSNGSSLDDALLGGRNKMEQIAQTDVGLAGVHAARAAMDAGNIAAYRRVPDGGACVFCLTAATQRYHAGDLMPMHECCGCVTAPIFGGSDPGRVIEKSALKALKAGDVEGSRALFSVTKDPEMGSRLTTVA